ncbi:AAA family ATPase [Candidatus Uhrbacteria bacterium]|nr:AAA family ATPase [Candidatus Uhrbacteria bacterium]
MPERGSRSVDTVVEEARKDPVAAFIRTLEEKKGIDMTTIVPASVDFSYLTPEQRAETYWALFQEAKGVMTGRKATKEDAQVSEEGSMKGKLGKKQKERLLGTLSLLKTLGEDEEAIEIFHEHYDRHLYEIENLNGNKEKYVVLRREIRDLEDIYDASAKELFSHRAEGISESQIIAFEVAQNQLEVKRDVLQELLEISPKLWAQAMYDALKRYAHELKQQNFIWTPSRRGYLEEIEGAALGGKPLLFSGESGTGKTRLVEQAARVFTGHPPAETPGKDTRFQDLIAKRSFRKEGDKEVVYYVFAEIGEAVTGKESTLDEEPIHEGRFVADDEFNLLEESEQNTCMSRVSSWTSGRRLRCQSPTPKNEWLRFFCIARWSTSLRIGIAAASAFLLKCFANLQKSMLTTPRRPQRIQNCMRCSSVP